ncbi:hypothetical protein [Mycobacterium intracellulare]|uniref:hypothetical protein n=1 Tax=Mycobacterium intracellulare TaxID=1767 RepID=UPI001EED2622|nr:hypothetical protein [Mycobacterium intracellulare]MEE3755233.1 hypothetical protein [Mycobacterium intracellulare]
MEVAYVTDPSYNADEHLDFGKILPVAADVDGLDDESTLLFDRPSLAELAALAKPSAAPSGVSHSDTDSDDAAESGTPVPTSTGALPDPVVDFEQTVVGIPIPDLGAPELLTYHPYQQAKCHPDGATLASRVNRRDQRKACSYQDYSRHRHRR